MFCLTCLIICSRTSCLAVSQRVDWPDESHSYLVLQLIVNILSVGGKVPHELFHDVLI
jgi:hypothetical protein